MTKHKTGSRDEWLRARLDLLKAEKEHTRKSGDEPGEAAAASRRVRVDAAVRGPSRSLPVLGDMDSRAMAVVGAAITAERLPRQTESAPRAGRRRPRRRSGLGCSRRASRRPMRACPHR
jgi:hypothetical protein